MLQTRAENTVTPSCDCSHTAFYHQSEPCSPYVINNIHTSLHVILSWTAAEVMEPILAQWG